MSPVRDSNRRSLSTLPVFFLTPPAFYWLHRLLSDSSHSPVFLSTLSEFCMKWIQSFNRIILLYIILCIIFYHTAFLVRSIVGSISCSGEVPGKYLKVCDRIPEREQPQVLLQEVSRTNDHTWQVSCMSNDIMLLCSSSYFRLLSAYMTSLTYLPGAAWFLESEFWN